MFVLRTSILKRPVNQGASNEYKLNHLYVFKYVTSLYRMSKSDNDKNEKPKPAMTKGKERNASTKRYKGNQPNLGTRVLVFLHFSC